MLRVCQGHEKGVGLEIFFKSLYLLNDSETKKLQLHASKKSILETCQHLGIKNIELNNESISIGTKKISVVFLSKSKVSETTNSLESCIESLDSGDALFTLPTSKDQLNFEKRSCAGYTDYLKKRFPRKNICMNFMSTKRKVLLLTDHIPLTQVPKDITRELIVEKTKSSLLGLRNISII